MGTGRVNEVFKTNGGYLGKLSTWFSSGLIHSLANTLDKGLVNSVFDL